MGRVHGLIHELVHGLVTEQDCFFSHGRNTKSFVLKMTTTICSYTLTDYATKSTDMLFPLVSKYIFVPLFLYSLIDLQISTSPEVSQIFYDLRLHKNFSSVPAFCSQTTCFEGFHTQLSDL